MEQQMKARNSGTFATTDAQPSSSSFIEQASQKVVIQGQDLRESSEFADNTNSKSCQKDGQNEEESRVSNFFVWGDNASGQLALRDQTQHVSDPIAISLASVRKLRSVACGVAHSVLVSEGGYVFAMGDNTFGQLGVPQAQKAQSSYPILVPGFGPSPGQTITEAHCADNASFILVKQERSTESDVIYSWGSLQSGCLGRNTSSDSDSDDEKCSKPGKVEFPDQQQQQNRVIKVSKISIGSNHAACVTQDSSHSVFVWGANDKGQLGIGDTLERALPTLNPLTESQQTAQISCGKSFTFLISGQNEIMVSGKLPFTVQTEVGEDQDFIMTFQSIAQFDQRVQIVQLEASRFASIVVDPVEEGQPKELFFWGQSPLGVFNELTPLNQLFSGSYEQQNESESAQTFNVSAVKNGLNFCVFVDQESGMTYQVGAENMVDPYIDDALVSLSELRDAQFDCGQRFACGSNFVLGESKTEGTVMQSSPMKKVNDNQLRQSSSPLKIMSSSPVKTQLNVASTIEVGLQLASPDGSKQSFPQRALYQGSVSPSTPTESCSMRSFSEQKSLKIRHKDLIGALKHVEGCQPVITTSETPNLQTQHDRNKSCFMGKKPGDSRINDDLKSQKEKEFSKTGDLVTSRDPRITEQEDEDEDFLKPNESITPEAICQEDDQKEQQQATGDKFTAQKRQEKKPTYSPDVSPIDGNQNWMMDANSYNHNISHGNLLDSVKRHDQRAFRIDDSQGKILMKQLSSNQMPLQMQHNNHLVYQQITQPSALSRSPESHHNNIAIARYLPVQQQTSLQSTPQRSSNTRHSNLQQQPPQLAYQAYHQHQSQLYTGAPAQMTMGMAPAQSMMQSIDQSMNQSGFLNYSQHQMQANNDQQQQSFYELMMKEKMESASIAGQLKESQRQLEKSRKEYAKLLSQVDEDQEETAQLKEKVRSQEATLSEMTIKVKDQDLNQEKLQSEKTKLEQEIKQTSKGYVALQTELSQAQQRIKEFESSKLTTCLSDKCRSNERDTDAMLQKRSKEIYDLTVRLGCLETENKELISQLEDRSQMQDSRIESSRILVEQELQEACNQIKELQEAYHEAQTEAEGLRNQKQTKMIHAGVQVKSQSATTQSKSVQTGTMVKSKSASQEFPRFVHSRNNSNQEKSHDAPVIVEPTYSMPQMPLAVFGNIMDSCLLEMDESFDASISFNQQEQQESSLGQEEESIDNSLREFKFIENETRRDNRQSMELPQVINAPLAQRQSSASKLTLYQTSQTSDRDKPKHNFLINRSNATIDPKILQTGRSSARNIKNSARQLKEDHNRSTHFVPNFPELHQTNVSHQANADLSMVNLADPSAEQEESWQTFKPMTTCPNERYSLKRHQEIFMESQFSQKDESNDGGEENSESNVKKQELPEQQDQQKVTPYSRRAKSNSDAGCLQINAMQKTARRARHERKNAQSKGNNLMQENQSNFDDGTSQHSLGVISNMTTPINHRGNQRFDRGNKTMLAAADVRSSQGLTERGGGLAHSKSKGSLLRQPTIIENSPATEATLHRIGSSQKLAVPATARSHINVQQKVPASTKNSSNQDQLFLSQMINEARQPCQTPNTRTNEMTQNYFTAKRHSVGSCQVRPRPTTSNHHQNYNNVVARQAMQTARPSITSSMISQSRSHAQLTTAVNANRSVTPRVKSSTDQSTSNLYGNAVHSRNSTKQSSVSTQHASATARRVAYDHRRKLVAQRSMKAMANHQSKQTILGSTINRQARAAVAQVNAHSQVHHHQMHHHQTTLQPENTSLSMQEEPFTHPPQKSVKPEVSIVEESDIPVIQSARGVPEKSIFNESDKNVQRNQLSHTMHTVLNGAQPNPFQMTPYAPETTCGDESNHLEVRGYLQTDADHPRLLSCQSAQTLNNCLDNVSDNRSSQEPSHLNEMKEKLYQIQSNKMLLESKIKEYETKLKQISQEPESQEILAMLKSRSTSRHHQDGSTENVFADLNNTGSDMTLGESGKTSEKHTPRHLKNKRQAFAQLNNVTNVNNQNSSQNISFNGSQISNGSKAYRDCKLIAPQNLPHLIKAPAHMMARTHYANQQIFRQ